MSTATTTTTPSTPSWIANLRFAASDTLRIARGAAATMRSAAGPETRLAPSQLDAIQQCVTWLGDYISKPHPQLGRNGDICPFVRTALRKHKMSFLVLDRVTRPDIDLLRDRMMYEGWRMARGLDESDRHAELTTVMLLLPALKGADAAVVHTVHDRCKANLMRRGIMTAAFYPGYDKPGVYNLEFKLYQAPFPVMLVRPMAQHDILFLDKHREAFTEYHRRFATQFHAGKISNEFGYPERFREAEQRFGLARG
jgi:heptaprenyl diphosphate synthase